MVSVIEWYRNIGPHISALTLALEKQAQESLLAIQLLKDSALAEISAAKGSVDKSSVDQPTSYKTVAARSIPDVPKNAHQVANKVASGKNLSQKLIKKNKFTHSVHIRAIDSESVSTDQVEFLLTKKVCSSKSNINVKRISKTKNSIYINFDDKESADKLASTIESDKELKQVMELSESKPLLPTISIQGLNKAIPGEEIIDFLVFNYPEFEEYKNDFQFIYTANSERFRTQKAFFRVTPEILNLFKNLGMLVRIGLNQCKVQLKYLVRQCQLCWSFNHHSKFCDQQNNAKACLVCAELIPPNAIHACSGTVCCHNCKTSNNKMFNKNTGHSVKSLSCPLYKSRYSSMISKTNLDCNV